MAIIISECNSGEIFDEVTGLCKCGNGFTCLGSLTAPFCDSREGKCKCSSEVESCNLGQICLNGRCEPEPSCANPGETYVGGVCKCGRSPSCDGSLTAPFCDASNNVCKCSSTVDSCKNLGETCQNGQCKCGTIDSCASLTEAPYCNAEASVCKCSENTEACNQLKGQTCSNGLCKNLGRQ